MNRKNHGQQPSHFAQDNGGYILIIGIVTVVAIITIITIKTALSSISNLQTNDIALDATQSISGAQSCLEDTLIRLNWNNEYTGESYTIGNISCSVTITGAGNDRNILATGTLDNNSQTYSVDVTLAPFAIVNWD